MKTIIEQNNAKRLPISSLARTTLSTGLLFRLGLNTSQSLLSDIISVKKPDLRSALVSKKCDCHCEHVKKLARCSNEVWAVSIIRRLNNSFAELSAIFAQLRSSGFSMTPSQLKKVLNENWGEGWLKNFKNFEVRPFAAASIGQVHKATLKSGETVAIKVQFPGVKKSIDNDLNTLKFIMKNSGMLPANFPLEYYISQCGELLRQETTMS